ncbi:MAG: hypothetical protein AAF581_10205 [Planctomycetota bacterium]
MRRHENRSPQPGESLRKQRWQRYLPAPLRAALLLVSAFTLFGFSFVISSNGAFELNLCWLFASAVLLLAFVAMSFRHS